MADQTFRKVEGIVTDVPVKIDDHFVHIDFQVIDMGEDEYDPPIILGRPFLSTVKAIIYIGTGEVPLSCIGLAEQHYYRGVIAMFLIYLDNITMHGHSPVSQ